MPAEPCRAVPSRDKPRIALPRRTCRAWPRPDPPCLPRRAMPRRTMPGPACRALPSEDTPRLPCLAMPRRASPRLPRPAVPSHAQPPTGRALPATPCLAAPCLALPALPGLALLRPATHRLPCLPSSSLVGGPTMSCMTARLETELATRPGPFEQMLAHPDEQFDPRGELLASIVEYAAAPSSTASAARSQTPHVTITGHLHRG